MSLQDAKFASAISEMEEVHKSELQHVRVQCERQLRDEVERARHDVTRALEEQTQVLPVGTPFLLVLGI
jgi:hypothetical protein